MFRPWSSPAWLLNRYTWVPQMSHEETIRNWFKFAPDGRIAEWRDSFDPQTILRAASVSG